MSETKESEIKFGEHWKNSLRARSLDCAEKAAIAKNGTSRVDVVQCQTAEQIYRTVSQEFEGHIQPEIERLKLELERVTKERDAWKANHDNQVKIKRAVLDRPDLGDRARMVQSLISERDTALQQLKEAIAVITLVNDAMGGYAPLAEFLARQKGL